MSVNKLP